MCWLSGVTSVGGGNKCGEVGHNAYEEEISGEMPTRVRGGWRYV